MKKIFDKFVITCLILMVSLVLLALAIGAWGHYVKGYNFAGTDGIVEKNAVNKTTKDVTYQGFKVPVPKADWIAFAAGGAIAGLFFGYQWTKIVGDQDA